MKWRDAKQYEQHKKSKCQSCSKIIFLIIILILSTGWSKPKWSDVFQVKLIDKNVLFSQYLEGTISEWDLKYDYDIYEITNTTSKAYRNVTLVVTVRNTSVLGKKYNFSYESYIGTIQLGETVEYRLMWSDIYKVAEEEEKEISFAEKEISKIKFSE